VNVDCADYTFKLPNQACGVDTGEAFRAAQRNECDKLDCYSNGLHHVYTVCLRCDSINSMLI